MKYLFTSLIFSLSSFIAHADSVYPLNGTYMLTDNTCAPFYAVNQQLLIGSDANSLSIHSLEGCVGTKACDPAQVPQGYWGEYGVGIQSNIGAEGLVVATGTYARNNTEFVWFENESNDTAGGPPGYGTTLVVILFEGTKTLEINYRGIYCTLKPI